MHACSHPKSVPVSCLTGSFALCRTFPTQQPEPVGLPLAGCPHPSPCPQTSSIILLCFIIIITLFTLWNDLIIYFENIHLSPTDSESCFSSLEKTLFLVNNCLFLLETEHVCLFNTIMPVLGTTTIHWTVCWWSNDLSSTLHVQGT